MNRKIAIFGSGPGGMYVAYRLIRKGIQSRIDVFDTYPIPYGKLRTSVAPDHQEMKNPIKVFDKLFEENMEKLNFYGNVPQKLLSSNQNYFSENYDCICLSHGSDGMCLTDIPGSRSLIKAEEIIRYYNCDNLDGKGLISIDKDIMKENIAIIGAGNVSIDIVRMLVKDIDSLRHTDVNPDFIQARTQSKLKSITIFSRSGIYDQKMSAASLRELAKINQVKIVFQNINCSNNGNKKSRLIKLIEEINSKEYINSNRYLIKFMLNTIPLKVCPNNDGLQTISCKIDSKIIEKTFDKIILSTGFKVSPIALNVKFDDKKMNYFHDNGFVHMKDEMDGHQITKYSNFFCSGWTNSGPKGTIADSMINSFNTADEISSYLSNCQNFKNLDHSKPLENMLKEHGIRFTSFKDWKKVNQIELELGKLTGKIRSKICDRKDLLQLID